MIAGSWRVGKGGFEGYLARSYSRSVVTRGSPSPFLREKILPEALIASAETAIVSGGVKSYMVSPHMCIQS